MKKKFSLLVAIIFLSSISLFGALSPLNQSAHEIETIISSSELQGLGQSGEIQSIVRVKNGYIVSTREHDLFVELIYVQGSKIGPRQFKLIFHPPTER